MCPEAKRGFPAPAPRLDPCITDLHSLGFVFYSFSFFLPLQPKTKIPVEIRPSNRGVALGTRAIGHRRFGVEYKILTGSCGKLQRNEYEGGKVWGCCPLPAPGTSGFLYGKWHGAPGGPYGALPGVGSSEGERCFVKHHPALRVQEVTARHQTSPGSPASWCEMKSMLNPVCKSPPLTLRGGEGSGLPTLFCSVTCRVRRPERGTGVRGDTRQSDPRGTRPIPEGRRRAQQLPAEDAEGRGSTQSTGGTYSCGFRIARRSLGQQKGFCPFVPLLPSRTVLPFAA